MDVPSDVIKKIKNSNDILLLVHPKPDGDAIGSIVAMGKGLKKLGKNVDYFVDSNIEPKLNIFDEIKYFNKDIQDHYNTVITLDASTPDYVVTPENMPSYEDLVVIDHHKSNEKFGDYNFVEITGACGELVYLILKELGVELDSEMEEALFTALSSDTGSFQFSNTTKQTHEIAAELYHKDTNFAPLSKRLHSLKNKDQLALYAHAINSMKSFDDGEIVFLELPYDVIEEHGGINNLTDDISNIGTNLDSSKVSVLIKEQEPDKFRISIRSKSPYDIDVSKVAVKFGGGGHFRAAGASFEGSIEDLEKKLLEELRKEIK